MRKIKIAADKMLLDSPILDLVEDEQLVQPTGLAVSGQINIGKNGHQVTVLVEDEETGETLEVNHVRAALLIIEDSRKSSSGWLSVAVGSITKLNSVLSFLSKITLEGLEKLAKRQ